MFGARSLATLALAIGFSQATLLPANAAFEKVGKETIDQALDKLASMQDRLVKDIFDDANQFADKVINEASNERKAAVIQLSSEIRYLVNTLSDQFGTESRKTVSQVSDEVRRNIAVLLAWTGSFDKVLSEISALQDDFAIDLQSLPFVEKYFSIRRVSGVNILQGERATYAITVTGERFGRPNSDEEISVNAHIGGKELDRGPTETNRVEFQLPAKLIEEHFRPNEVNMVDLNISAVRKKKRCIPFLSCYEEKAHGTFKLVLLPEQVGKLKVQIHRPKYAWVERETALRYYTVKSPGPLELGPLSPQDGKRRRYGTPTTTCMNIQREAWRLPNGRILLPGDPLLTKGWISSRWTGSPPGPGLASIEKIAESELGFNPGFYARSVYTGNDDHPRVSPDEIRAQSQKLTELGYCDIMKASPANMEPERQNGKIDIVGSAPHETLFEVKTPIEVYEHVGFEPDPNSRTFDVSSTGQVNVEVPDDTLVSLTFHAFDGTKREGQLPQGLPRGLRSVQDRKIGQMTVYTLQFDRSR